MEQEGYMSLYPDDDLTVVRSRGNSSLSDAQLRDMVQKAEASFHALPAELQHFHKLAQRVSMQCSVAPAGTSREEVARNMLSRDVSQKYADWMLEKAAFRTILGL